MQVHTPLFTWPLLQTVLTSKNWTWAKCLFPRGCSAQSKEPKRRGQRPWKNRHAINLETEDGGFRPEFHIWNRGCEWMKRWLAARVSQGRAISRNKRRKVVHIWEPSGPVVFSKGLARAGPAWWPPTAPWPAISGQGKIVTTKCSEQNSSSEFPARAIKWCSDYQSQTTVKQKKVLEQIKVQIQLVIL